MVQATRTEQRPPVERLDLRQLGRRHARVNRRRTHDLTRLWHARHQRRSAAQSIARPPHLAVLGLAGVGGPAFGPELRPLLVVVVVQLARLLHAAPAGARPVLLLRAAAEQQSVSADAGRQRERVASERGADEGGVPAAADHLAGLVHELARAVADAAVHLRDSIQSV